MTKDTKKDDLIKQELEKTNELYKEVNDLMREIESYDIQKNDIKKSKQFIADQKERLERVEYLLSLNKHNIFLLDRFDYIETKLNKYLTILKETKQQVKEMFNKEDLTSDEVNNQLQQFKDDYIKYYIVDIESGNFDLYNKEQLKIFSERLTNTLLELQIGAIMQIGYDIFLKTDTDKKTFNFNMFLSASALKLIQDKLKSKIKNKKYELNNDDALFKEVFNLEYKKIYEDISKEVKDNEDEYKRRNLKYLEVDKLTSEIQQDLETLLSKTTTDILVSNSMLNTGIDTDKDINKNKTIKQPKQFVRDIDLIQLFNNVYPNYKFKSIYEDRRKEHDIKAQLVFDIDNNDLEHIRLYNFINEGKIALYPLQQALITGFISIRNAQDDIDRTIPLLNALKFMSQDSKMRLPTSKKDLTLYQDFMLFFRTCKLDVKITNRKTGEVVYRLSKPMPLLENTEAYKNATYGYIIGNSVLNVLKNDLDDIYDTPHKITTSHEEQLFNVKAPKTPPMLNIVHFIEPKIKQMIHSYKTRRQYQHIINITKLYDFQAMYNKHPKPTTDDRKTAREKLNQYLDHLITKKVIKDYKPLKDKKNSKETNQYYININEDRYKDIKDNDTM